VSSVLCRVQEGGVGEQCERKVDIIRAHVRCMRHVCVCWYFRTSTVKRARRLVGGRGGEGKGKAKGGGGGVGAVAGVVDMNAVIAVRFRHQILS
jgi:hypothetical protein